MAWYTRRDVSLIPPSVSRLLSGVFSKAILALVR